MTISHHRLIKILILVLVFAISGSVIYFKDTLVNFSQYGHLGIFLVSFFGSATVLFPVPSLLATFAVGHVYNPFIIGPIAATGAALGELTGYVAGIGGRVLLTNQEKFLRQTQDRIKRYGVLFIVIFAAIPNPLFDLVGIAAGLIGIKPVKFFIAAWLGQIIKFTATAYLGASLKS